MIDAGRRSAHRLVLVPLALFGLIAGAGCATRGDLLERCAEDAAWGAVAAGAPMVVAALPITIPIAVVTDDGCKSLAALAVPGIPTGIVGFGVGCVVAFPIELLKEPFIESGSSGSSAWPESFSETPAPPDPATPVPATPVCPPPPEPPAEGGAEIPSEEERPSDDPARAESQVEAGVYRCPWCDRPLARGSSEPRAPAGGLRTGESSAPTVPRPSRAGSTR